MRRKDLLTKWLNAFEALVGRPLEVASGCLRGGELQLAFEQLCTVALEEPIELSASILDEMRSFAEASNSPELIAKLVTIQPGSRRRSWMDQRPQEQVGPNRTDEKLWLIAYALREARSLTPIVDLATETLGRQPLDVEVARFIRMAAPSTPFEIVADTVIAFTFDGDLNTANALLEPWLAQPLQ